MTRRCLLLLAFAWGPGWTCAEDVNFASQIQPLLARRCYACHGPEQQQSGLRFDQRESLLATPDSGDTVVDPGNPDGSSLILRITSDDLSNRMPPEGNALTDTEVALLRNWIAQGAPYERHWAFQPITQPIPPIVQRLESISIPIDLFVQSRLEKAGIGWSDPAEPAVLVRRAFMDVVGLPPSPEVVARWTGAWSDETYQQLVEDLLASPAMGERWARMWLDVVRYAESNSFERDNPKPNAWKYRDWVIRSFNSDKPYDRFVREQIAGDELDEVNLETLTATGYYRLGIWDDEPADPLQAQFDEYDDLVSTTSQAFLGLTMGCARCHDHKIDPLTQRDYYSMVAFMRDVTSYGTRSDQESNNQLDLRPDIVEEHKRAQSKVNRLKRRLEKMEQAAIEKMPAPDQRATEGPEREAVLNAKLKDFMDGDTWQAYSQQKQELVAAQHELNALPPRITTLGLARLESRPPATFVLHRGSPHSHGAEVSPAFPELLGGGNPEISPAGEDARSAGRRRVLAEWLAAEDNWLTARVIVNRIWQHYFGRGIVRSPNNFGLMGHPPTHPELVDFLATELIRNDWSLKHVHRQILLSATYRRSTQNLDAAVAADPENNLFWRQNLRRLSAEQLRDAILTTTGQLNLAQAGPPMYPELSAEVLASQSQPGRNWERSSASEQARRSVYIHVKRSLPVPLLSVFDFPETDVACEARFLTVQPGQALSLLNSHWMQQQSLALLGRLEREVGQDLQRQAERCLELVQGVPGTPEDVGSLLRLVDHLQHQLHLDDTEARRRMCLVALNLNSFLYLE
ncbi:MAG: PSD1 domain-containing protein [Pirellulaceae bacterium]|nr:PSD1 domain-containing protein [Pirellulaceae bacterium]